MALDLRKPDATRPPAPTPAPAPRAATASRFQGAWRAVARWESALLLLLIGSILYGRSTSSYFLSTDNLFFIGLNIAEIAIMALPLSYIVITGEVDLSVAAMLGLSSTVLGVLFRDGWSLWIAMAAALVVGGLGGALNGALVTRLGLPSIAVTIGTLTLFRGVAEILLKSDAVTGFPIGWTNIGILPFPGTKISYSVVVFIGLALVFGVVLHATPLGRSIYAIGLQQEAAFFSGIRVQRIKFWLFVLSGVVCALAGILWTFRFATARYNNGNGLELNAVAMVLLAGVSIFGGRGTIVGIVLSAAVLGCLQQAMTLENVPAQVQSIVIGVLLLVSVVVPNGPALLERVRRRLGSSSSSRAAAAKGISILTGPGTPSAIETAGPEGGGPATDAET